MSSLFNTCHQESCKGIKKFSPRYEMIYLTLHAGNKSSKLKILSMYLEVVTAVDVTIEEANRRCTEAVSLFTTIC